MQIQHRRRNIELTQIDSYGRLAEKEAAGRKEGMKERRKEEKNEAKKDGLKQGSHLFCYGLSFVLSKLCALSMPPNSSHPKQRQLRLKLSFEREEQQQQQQVTGFPTISDI